MLESEVGRRELGTGAPILTDDLERGADPGRCRGFWITQHGVSKAALADMPGDEVPEVDANRALGAGGVLRSYPYDLNLGVRKELLDCTSKCLSASPRPRDDHFPANVVWHERCAWRVDDIKRVRSHA